MKLGNCDDWQMQCTYYSVISWGWAKHPRITTSNYYPHRIISLIMWTKRVQPGEWFSNSNVYIIYYAENWTWAHLTPNSMILMVLLPCIKGPLISYFLWSLCLQACMVFGASLLEKTHCSCRQDWLSLVFKHLIFLTMWLSWLHLETGSVSSFQQKSFLNHWKKLLAFFALWKDSMTLLKFCKIGTTLWLKMQDRMSIVDAYNKYICICTYVDTYCPLQTKL